MTGSPDQVAEEGRKHHQPEGQNPVFANNGPVSGAVSLQCMFAAGRNMHIVLIRLVIVSVPCFL